MKTKMFRKPIFFSLLVVLLFIIAPVAMAQDTVTLTLLVDDGEIDLTQN
jgi:hypothetical protein